MTTCRHPSGKCRRPAITKRRGACAMHEQRLQRAARARARSAGRDKPSPKDWARMAEEDWGPAGQVQGRGEADGWRDHSSALLDQIRDTLGRGRWTCHPVGPGRHVLESRRGRMGVATSALYGLQRHGFVRLGEYDDTGRAPVEPVKGRRAS